MRHFSSDVHGCTTSCACVMQRGLLPVSGVSAEHMRRVSVVCRRISPASRCRHGRPLQEQLLTLHQVTAVRQLLDRRLQLTGGSEVSAGQLCWRLIEFMLTKELQTQSTWLLMDAPTAVSCILKGEPPEEPAIMSGVSVTRVLLQLAVGPAVFMEFADLIYGALCCCAPPSCVSVADMPAPFNTCGSSLVMNLFGSCGAPVLQVFFTSRSNWPHEAGFTVDGLAVGIDSVLLLQQVASDQPLSACFFPRVPLTHITNCCSCLVSEALLDLHSGVLHVCAPAVGSVHQPDLLLHYCRLLTLGFAPPPYADWRLRHELENRLVFQLLRVCNYQWQQRLLLHRFLRVHMSAVQCTRRLRLFLATLMQMVYGYADCCPAADAGHREMALSLRLEIAAVIGASISSSISHQEQPQKEIYLHQLHPHLSQQQLRMFQAEARLPQKNHNGCPE